MVSWDKAFTRQSTPIRLDSGAHLVTSPALITTVLKDKVNYVDESAFLRTATFFPLPPQVRMGVVRDFIRLMTPATDQVPDVIRDRWQKSGRFAMQGDGVWLMYSLYQDRIHHPERSGDYAKLIKYYIERKTIHDDIQGGFKRLEGKPRADLDASLGAVIAADRSSFKDLVDIVQRTDMVTLPNEQSELLLRLVQSLVAFTGTALEAAFYHVGRNPRWGLWIQSEEHARAYLMEMQRLFPTAWRLTRTASQDHVLGSAAVRAGEQIILGSSVAHKTQDSWGSNATTFDPQRWLNPDPPGLFSFGAGHGTCPGKNIALDVLTKALWSTVSSFSIEAPSTRTPRPYVRSILAAPRVALTVRPK